MKAPRGGASGWLEPRNVNLTVFLVCILLVPLYFLFDTMTNPAQSIVNLQVSNGKRDDQEKAHVVEEHGRENVTDREEAGRTRRTTTPKGDGWIECDFSQSRSDTCEIQGDVRVHGPSSSVVLVLPSNSNDIINSNTKSSSTKIRPYARKWENHTMLLIRELTLNSSWSKLPKCDVMHPIGSTAIIFSTGGFRENFFHEIVDVLIPLFLTSHQFHGNVHLLVEDFSPRWVDRYLAVLRRLSRHVIINLETDDKVHCFNRAVVGLKSTMELGIDPEKSPRRGPSMLDFKALLRRSFKLPREFATLEKKKPPRILFLSRKETRVLLNELEVIEMVRGLGYEVVVAVTETTKNLTLMASVVNSCDVMLGVHGAGLTNMVFLPTNATLIEIIPWGEMRNASKYSYGDPAIGMGLRYINYEITMNETSLINKYPRDHAVFTDPISIHKQGYLAMWTIFWHQDITLDVAKFRVFLSQALSK